MNLRNLIKWSALFFAILAYKQYEAAEINERPVTNDMEQHISGTPNHGR